MTKYSSRCWLALLVAAVALLALPGASFAQGPSLTAHPLTGAPPQIDGSIGLNEWPYAPQISITEQPAPPPAPQYVVPTYATFVNDGTYLYVLVDAQGDTTPESFCDECLLVFGWMIGTEPQELRVEIYKKAGEPPVVETSGVLAAMGFTGHRIYEFRIPLAMIGNPAPGDPIQFCSPSVGKWCYSETVTGSMPFDGVDGSANARDNIWPFDLNYTDRATWATVALARDGVAVPALDPRGALLLAVLLAAAAAFVLGRRSL